MLDKSTGLSNNYYIELLMQKQESKNEAIVTTTKGDYYGKIIAVNNEKVIIKQEGQNITFNTDIILDVQ